MAKRGRFETKPRTSTTKKYRNSQSKLLLSLVSSVVSLLLCCSMFLGTTMAWFTDTVTSAGNQITIGTLEVDITYEGKSLNPDKEENPDAVYASDMVWIPDQFEARELTVENSGNLDIKYELNLQASDASVAKYFDVYVYEGSVQKKGKLAADERTGWTKVENLETIYEKGLSVVEGSLDAAANGAATTKTFGIALHMPSSVEALDGDKTIFGKSFTMYIKLNAYQSDAPVSESGSDNGSDSDTDIEIGDEATTFTGEQAEPLKLESGSYILDNVTVKAAEGHAVEVTGNATVMVKGTTTLVGASGGSGIYVGSGASLTLTGETLIAKGNNGAESTSEEVGGHGIGGEGTIKISGLDNLTAEGYGKHAFGIGGPTESITVSNTHITKVQGGYYGATGTDTKYEKDAPEGGAAIGSSVNGASITLDNVHIKEALGGSKSAGIGAMFHIGVTINITDCTIEKVVGGVSAAGIGGSRIGDTNSADQDVNINIIDSVITAVGGKYGAGIGSGYDTYCHLPELSPICTINIKGSSVITATGGQYAAGVGTGYHAGGLAGEIEVEITAASGEKLYKDSYTQAQDVGFGVLDPTRDGLNNTCSIKYVDNNITIPAVTTTTEG